MIILKLNLTLSFSCCIHTDISLLSLKTLKEYVAKFKIFILVIAGISRFCLYQITDKHENYIGCFVYTVYIPHIRKIKLFQHFSTAGKIVPLPPVTYLCNSKTMTVDMVCVQTVLIGKVAGQN